MTAERQFGSGRLVGALFPLASAFCLSVNNAAQSLYYDAGGTVPLMLLMRHILYIACCLVLFPLIGKCFAIGGPNFRAALVSGTIYAIGMTTLLAAFLYIPVSLVILTLYTFPILTALMDAAVKRHWPGIGQLVCLLMAFAGLAVALEVTTFAHDPLGIFLVTVTAFCFAAAFVWNGHKLADVDGTLVTFHMAIPGLVIMSVIAIFFGTGDFPLPDSATFAPMWIALIAYLVAFVTMFKGVEVIGPTPSAMIMNLEPVFTMMLAVVVLSEVLTPLRLLGAAIVLSAVLTSQWLATRRVARNAAI